MFLEYKLYLNRFSLLTAYHLLLPREPIRSFGGKGNQIKPQIPSNLRRVTGNWSGTGNTLS